MKTLRNIFILFALFIFVTMQGYCQNEPTDSLKNLLTAMKQDSVRVNTLILLSRKYLGTSPSEAKKYADEALKLADSIGYRNGQAYSLKNLGLAANTEGNYLEAIDYWEKALKIFEALNDKSGIANMENNIGLVFFNKGSDEKAFEYYFKALKTAEEIKDTFRIATTYLNIGAVYNNKKATYDKAKEYYLLALPLCERLGDNQLLGTAAVNLGEIYFAEGNDSLTLHYYLKSLKAYEGTQDAPYTLSDLGKYYNSKKDFARAISYHKQAYELAKSLDSKNDMTIALIGLGDTYYANGDNLSALSAYTEAENLSEEVGAIYQKRDAYKGLTLVYSRLKDQNNAFQYQTKLIAIKDSIYDIETDKKLGTIQFTYDLDKKESQINIQKQEISKQKIVRNGFIGGFVVVLLFAVVFFSQRNRISKEKKRSDELLLNILPEETAEELKLTGKAKAKKFDIVSVLFTDFKNFTQASEKLSPEDLVEEINHCYSEFDKIITRHGIEKIKTIGDAYMCAGGLPVANQTHPFDVVSAGLEMVEFIEKNKKDRMEKGQPYFELRLGIHTGPVVAGIVGIKKFAYDIWGDTVNTASRMESSGEIGKVNISGATYELVKDKFKCSYRGKIQAKNKGEIDMYFVS